MAIGDVAVSGFVSAVAIWVKAGPAERRSKVKVGSLPVKKRLMQSAESAAEVAWPEDERPH
jgi:hypothetical protein